MPITKISELVSDWGGFEKLVAELHSTGEISVERNVVLKGRSGASRQIDVVVRHRQGLYDHLVIIECKYLKRPVSRSAVDALASAMLDLGASKGVIFSRDGFQEGAKRLAKNSNIDLFRIRDVVIKGPRYIRCVSIIEYSLLEIASTLSIDGIPVEHKWTLENLVAGGENQAGVEVSGLENMNDAQFGSLLFDLFRELHESKAASLDPHHEGLIRYIGDVERDLSHVITDRVGKPEQANGLVVRIAVKAIQNHFFIDKLKNKGFILAVEDCVRRKYNVMVKNSDHFSFLLPANVASDAIPQKVASSQIDQNVLSVELPLMVPTAPIGFDNLMAGKISYEKL